MTVGRARIVIAMATLAVARFGGGLGAQVPPPAGSDATPAALSEAASRDRATGRAEGLAASDGGADALAVAWLDDLLGAEPAITLAAYRAVFAAEDSGRAHRLRAAARALPLAAALRDDAATEASAHALVQLGLWHAGANLPALRNRLAATQQALRTWAAGPFAPDADLRTVMQRLNTEPWRTLDSLGARAGTPNDDEHLTRGAASDLPRPRIGAVREPGAEPVRPRALQQRRWARDVLQWELDGQRDKAARIFPALVRRRDGRGAFTQQRLETEFARAQGLTNTDRQLLGRAIATARQRLDAGDQRGAQLLIGAGLTLLRTGE